MGNNFVEILCEAIVLFLIIYHIFVGYPKQESDNETMHKAFNLTKSFGNVNLRCLCFEYTDNDNITNYRYYLCEDDAETDFKKHVVALGYYGNNKTPKDLNKSIEEVENFLRYMPYSLRIIDTRMTYEEYFAKRIKAEEDYNENLRNELIARIKEDENNEMLRKKASEETLNII